MADRFSSLRLEIARCLRGGRSRATRYSGAVRRRAVRLTRSESARGVAVAATARALGLRPRTLRLWMGRPARIRLRRVEVTPTSPRPPVERETAPTLVTPQGYRVEGLELSSLVRLLRELR
jgi:transposase-like protein